MIWFTSDLHFNHENILKWSPIRHQWKNIEEMNWALVAIWNSVVKPEDTVYHMGDLFFKAKQKMGENKILWEALNGNKFLAKGNHDDVENLVSIGIPRENIFVRKILNIGGTDFLLGHYPYEEFMKEEDREDRPFCFTNAQKNDAGEVYPLLCGHVHDRWQIKPLCLNVGFDAWGRMLSDNDIIKIYSTVEDFRGQK